jgi:hypothetical protein
MPEHRKKKIMYYVDELSVFIICIIGVALSDTIQKISDGHLATANDIFLTWPQFLVSSLIAIMVYGGMYTKWKYNDENKPAWIKRASSALLQGVAWRTMVSLTGK